MGMRSFLKQEIPSEVPERAGWLLQRRGSGTLTSFSLPFPFQFFQVLNNLLYEDAVSISLRPFIVCNEPNKLVHDSRKKSLIIFNISKLLGQTSCFRGLKQAEKEARSEFQAVLCIKLEQN